MFPINLVYSMSFQRVKKQTLEEAAENRNLRLAAIQEVSK